MASSTKNYGLVKPDGIDVARIQVLNGNFDIIDAKLKEAMDAAESSHEYVAGENITIENDVISSHHYDVGEIDESATAQDVTSGLVLSVIKNIEFDEKGHVINLETVTMTFPTIDDVPTQNSLNLVYSGGAFDAVANKQDKLVAGENIEIAQDGKTISSEHYDVGEIQSSQTFRPIPRGGQTIRAIDDLRYDENGHVTRIDVCDYTLYSFDDVPTQGSEVPIKSGAVYTALQGIKTYTAGANITISQNGEISSQHPTIAMQQDTVVQEQVTSGYTLNTLASLSRDGFGHVTQINSKVVNFPNIDSTPQEDSTALVRSGGVYGALEDKADQTEIDRLDNIIASLGGGGVRSWPTVADMQADTFTEYPVVGHTEGFYASGDGGGAWYVINDTGTANGADVIACDDNASIAHYVHVGGSITPEVLGARGDGVTNDWLAVTRAIEIYPCNVVLSKTYYICSMPSYSYMSGYGNGMLYVSGVLHLSGGGTLKYPNNGVFVYDETHETYGMSMFLFNEGDVAIENITFDMNGSNNIIDSISNRNGEALLGTVVKCSIANVTFKNCAAAHTVMLSGGKAYYNNCTFVDCGTYLQNNTHLTSSVMLSVQHDNCFINGCIFTNSVMPSNPKTSTGIITYSGYTIINECEFKRITEAIHLNSQARQLNDISITNCIMVLVHYGIIYNQYNALSFITIKNNTMRCNHQIQKISVAIGCPDYDIASGFQAMEFQIEGNYIYNQVNSYDHIGIAVMGFTTYLSTIASNKIYANIPVVLGRDVNHIDISDNWLESQYTLPLIRRISSSTSTLSVIASDIIISNNTAKGGKLIADIASITNLTLKANYADIEQSILNNLPQGFNISLDGQHYEVSTTSNTIISNTIHDNIGEYTYKGTLIHTGQSTRDITISTDHIATLLSANIILNNGFVGTILSYTTNGYLNVTFRVPNVTSNLEYLVSLRYELGR